CVTEGLVLSVAMLVLPWRADVLLYGVTLVLALGYLCSAGLAVAPHPALARVLRGTAWFSLGAFFALCVQVLLWSLHLRSLYLELGWALTGGLIVFLLALALFLVPFSLYVLFGGGASSGGSLLPSTGHIADAESVKTKKVEAVVASLLPFVLLLVSATVVREAGADTTKSPPWLAGKAIAPEVAEQLAADWTAMGPTSRPDKVQGLAATEVITCKDKGTLDGAWAVTFLNETGPESR